MKVLRMAKGLGIEDLYKLTLVSDPKLSPNDSHVAFTVTRLDEGKDTYVSNIWILNLKTEEYSPFTSGGSDKTPFWSPDGKYIAFTSSRKLKEKERGVELWVKPLGRESEGRLLHTFKGGILDFDWNPDGKSMLVVSQVGEPDDDVKFIDRIPFWFNGMGLTYKTFSHVFQVDFYSGNVEQLTEGEYQVLTTRWSPDGKKIAYVTSEIEEKPYLNYLYIYDVETGEKTRVPDLTINVYSIAWSPDGKYIAIKGTDLSRGYATHANIYLMDTTSYDVENITVNIDKDLVNPANSDVRGPSMGRPLQWIGNDIYFHLADGGAVHLYKWNKKDGFKPIITGELVVDDYSVGRNSVIATIMDPVNPPEIYIFKKGTLKVLTHFNDFLLGKRKLQVPEKFTFKASDGETIEGWILKPVDYKEGGKYPALLEIHGGPATTYGYGFMHEFHVLSNEGYVIIFTNPRGSSGYSEDFKDIRGKYGERDYLDLMEAVEYVTKSYNFIDKSKLGVLGGSYGGFMTNWIVTHTDKFKAAVTQRSISNWISFYGTTDIGFHFGPDQIGGNFDAHFWTSDEIFERYWSMSPLKYIKNAKTPLLIIHSEQDYRCWLDQALQIYTTLKIRKIPTKLVIFPNENHDLSRSGKPKHRTIRLKEIINWFNKYLKEENKGG